MDNPGRAVILVSAKPRWAHRLIFSESALPAHEKLGSWPRFFCHRNHFRRYSVLSFILLAGVGRVRIKQGTLAALDANDVGWQFRVVVFAEANFAVDPGEVGGHHVVANGRSFGFHFSRLASHARTAHGVGIHVNNVISRGVHMVGSGFVDATFLGLIQEFLFKCPGAFIRVPPYQDT